MNEELIDKARQALQVAAEMSLHYYQKPLIITYSGGKDSDVLLHLARRFLKPNEFEVVHSVTTVDAPQTNRHVNEVFKDCEAAGIHTSKTIPHYKGKKINMWDLIVEKQTPPTRLMRYCCAVFKEVSTPNRFIATGVRGGESVGRTGRDTFSVRTKKKKDAFYYPLSTVSGNYAGARYFEDKDKIGANDPHVYDCKFVESAKKNKDLICNPIYEWKDGDIWDYIRQNKIKVNPLYEMGYRRVGCVGCPMASYRMRLKEFDDFPQIKAKYIEAFRRMLEARRAAGKDMKCDWGETAEDVFDWWIEKYKHEFRGQLSLFDSDFTENKETSILTESED